MRTDDDSWDIESSVGATALGVAAMRAAESRRPDALFHDPYAEVLVTAVGSESWTRIVRGEIPDLEQAATAAMGPIISALIARTCYLDAYVQEAAADGIRQLVIPAAGLDARAYRFEWPVGTTVFELDLPKVLEFKESALRDFPPAADRRAIAVDLRQDWPAALRDNGFDLAAPTAWLVEGLLRYLPADAQDRLFDNIVASSAPGSRIAIYRSSGAAPDSKALQDARSAGVDVTVDVGELWYSDEGRSDPIDWFTEHGWTVSRADPAEVLRSHGREVSDAAAAHLKTDILFTARRPGGDSTR
ncbi:class I SAM-dependent methyltransferase [Nocardia pseudovaccinii]|uniref:class I SAM-dependent methyltransferase n=1 Tax=Nocardia pseudovaccinii TaxID=189540 RepID=UPI0007A3CA43|nr:class I SAM-dependent methyltransferase [Nocardia pseudovaccinii]